MENSKIEWTDHTFNPWHGCVKVSEGCKNCYAETLDKRWNGGHWGPGSHRKAMSERYWRQPLKWNEDAAKKGVRAKVFCASMADVFEGHPQTLNDLERLFALIEKTPNLIWQLLTKRPENIMKLIPVRWKAFLPANIWIGTSVENQKAADERIPHLLEVPAFTRFLSMEPLLGSVNLQLEKPDNGEPMGIDWIIAGGESGHNARPVHPDWIRSIRDQAHSVDVPFFFKQWGEWTPFYDREVDDPDWRNLPKGSESHSVAFINLAGGTGFHGDRVVYFKKVGKKNAGAIVDGAEYKEFPKIIL